MKKVHIYKKRDKRSRFYPIVRLYKVDSSLLLNLLHIRLNISDEPKLFDSIFFLNVFAKSISLYLMSADCIISLKLSNKIFDQFVIEIKSR